jgi:hypothetical protein
MRPVKGSNTCTTHLWFYLHYQSAEFFIISSESLIFFLLKWVVSTCTRWYNIATNSRFWVLGIDCEYPMIETLYAVHKLSIVVLVFKIILNLKITFYKFFIIFLYNCFYSFLNKQMNNTINFLSYTTCFHNEKILNYDFLFLYLASIINLIKRIFF